MKYVAILNSLDELSEDAIKMLKDSVYVGDEKAPYCFDITSIKDVSILVPCKYRENDYAEGYNQALKDCGVII